MAKPKQPKVRERFSIGEWYGIDFESMSSAERCRRAKLEIELDALTGTFCPFQPKATCNKKGGACSLRRYKQVGDGAVIGTGPIITTCPQRFLDAGTIFRWVAETLLQTSEPIVLGEIGFLDRLRNEEAQNLDSN